MKRDDFYARVERHAPKLPYFSQPLPSFDRERATIGYLFKILEDLGGDEGPTMDTLGRILYRVRCKARTARKRGGK